MYTRCRRVAFAKETCCGLLIYDRADSLLYSTLFCGNRFFFLQLPFTFYAVALLYLHISGSLRISLYTDEWRYTTEIAGNDGFTGFSLY